MAAHLAALFGSTPQKLNCPFWWKIGACRHGDACVRLHARPTEASVVLVPRLYANPFGNDLAIGDHSTATISQKEDFFLEFYETIESEFAKFGTVNDILVCENTAEWLLGNVYVNTPAEAAAAVQNINGRSLAGRISTAELTQVTDFEEASCRMHSMGQCTRGDLCNFLHRKTYTSVARKIV